MKLSLEWLGDFVAFTEHDPEMIARAITAHTAEVDRMEVQGALLEHCCVGKILSIEKHPNADRLSVCEVQTDTGTKKVVCGGTNLGTGMRVAFAHIGARVRWHGTEMQMIQKTTIRGVESDGMICTAEELDLTALFPGSRERILIDLGNENEAIGAPLGTFLGLTDTIFHIDNHAITHRADLFSHIGFARECVAIGIAKWKADNEKRKTNKRINESTFAKTPIPFKFVIDQPRLMPRYCACMISIDAMGETPLWMKRRLEAIGFRSINLPIDITNYVASEVGVPLHSFDADDIRGTVHMRKAKEGEQITTLDGKEFVLPEGALVLSDDEGIFDLLGIMGGLRSSTKETTRTIYLHSASLDPVSIRRTVTATGHRTDAATVYEKGVPHLTTEQGFHRAVELFLELVPGARIASKLESQGDNGNSKPIKLSPDHVAQVLGVEIPEKKITKILTDLDCTVNNKKIRGPKSQVLSPKSLTVTPPLHRLGDIHSALDLIEEIGRIYGYDDIEPAVPVAGIAPPARDPRVHQLRDCLKECGYCELVPLSLLNPEDLRLVGMDPADAVALENPIGEELSLLQPSHLPALLAHAERNLEHVAKELHTFHIGHIFTVQTPHQSSSTSHDEHDALTLLICAKRPTDLTRDPFLTLKQHLTTALKDMDFGHSITSVIQCPAYAHPGRYASLGILGCTLGEIFEIHPDVRARFKLPARAAAAVLDLSALLVLRGHPRIATPLPQFPGITYDETIPRSHDDELGDTLKRLTEKHPLLEEIRIIDLYDRKPRYNLTLRCTYRAPDRTLTEDEAKKEHQKVMQEMGDRK